MRICLTLSLFLCFSLSLRMSPRPIECFTRRRFNFGGRGIRVPANIWRVSILRMNGVLEELIISRFGGDFCVLFSSESFNRIGDILCLKNHLNNFFNSDCIRKIFMRRHVTPPSSSPLKITRIVKKLRKRKRKKEETRWNIEQEDNSSR